MLIWIFGAVEHHEVHRSDEKGMAGFLSLQNANVRWFLSVDRDDLPDVAIRANKPTYRSMTVNGEEFEFSEGFTDLHTVVYKQILEGRGYGLDDARAAINLVYEIRNANATAVDGEHCHPFVSGGDDNE
jgi:UDP-N-acetyl-2-amino-2-deoxyglucuronate dehydrogenase